MSDASEKLAGIDVQVAEVRAETELACTVVLADSLPWRAGHFVTVRIPIAPGPLARCYSLCNGPDEPLAFTVKEVPGGRGSAWLCRHLQPGDRLRILPPAGTFQLADEPHPVLMCAAGSGITPVMAMLREVLAHRQDPVRLLYANRDEASVIFARPLAELSRRYPDRFQVVHWLEALLGLPDPGRLGALLARWTSERSRAYLCGPDPFMRVVATALAGLLPKARVHREVFNSLTGDPFTAIAPTTRAEPDSTTPLQVILDRDRTDLRWPRGELLLDTVLDAGLTAPYSCREGRCSACMCLLTRGAVEMDHNEVLEAEDLAAGWVLACQSRAVGSDPVVVSYDEE